MNWLKARNNKLLWAHYADAHKGFCIEYEKEIRLLFKENGEQEINGSAIKSIIFGAFASDEDINNTISRMSNKIKYYKIEIAKNNYKLLKKRL